MEYLLVVYFLMSGEWIRGDELDGWGSLPLPSQEICLERRQRAEKIHEELMISNPSARDKRFECEPREADGQD